MVERTCETCRFWNLQDGLVPSPLGGMTQWGDCTNQDFRHDHTLSHASCRHHQYRLPREKEASQENPGA